MSGSHGIPAGDMAKAASSIVSAGRVALACHLSPDGDALGSMLALHHVLVSAGREAVASFAGPQVIGAHYRELPGLDRLTDPSLFPPEPEVMVTLDCGSVDRLGSLGEPARRARELIVVDHHVSNTRFGSINLVDHSAAASAVVVERLVRTMDLPLTADAAVCLYAGLVCDTGRFQYESTTTEAFDLARRLLAFDVPVARLNRTLFEEHRYAYLQLVAEVLSRAVLVPTKRFIWASTSRNDLDFYGVTFEETEGLIDVIRQAREAEVSCVLKEAPDGVLRVSLRSTGSVDVSVIASKHGGGGHRFAAGFTTGESVDVVVERILADL
ncbi:MAG: DHH family phosphoesterase [Acidimicrobiia bacterium]